MTAMVTARHAVAPSAVISALRAMWKEHCGGDEDATISRALLTNLVVVVDELREAPMRLLLEHLSARLPCRAFLVAVHKGAGPFATEVHGAARLHGSTRDIVLEQIELRVPENAFSRVPGLVRPLLVHDLPTRCYWAAPWPEDPRRFDAMATMAELTILDSARFRLPASELDAVDQRRRRGMQLTDLEWMRLRPWRRALAEVFERARFREHTETHVTIRYGEHGMAGACLLGRWLEQRLAAQVVVEASGNNGQDVAGVELRHGDAHARIELVDGARLQVVVETEAACFLPLHVTASRGGEGDLLAAAIDLA